MKRPSWQLSWFLLVAVLGTLYVLGQRHEAIRCSARGCIVLDRWTGSTEWARATVSGPEPAAPIVSADTALPPAASRQGAIDTARIQRLKAAVARRLKERAAEPPR